MNEQEASLQELQHIKKMMEQSSRFISLSGLSGISAGVCALAGAWLASKKISLYTHANSLYSNTDSIDYETLVSQLMIIAAGVFVAAIILAFIFTNLRSKKVGTSIWGSASYRLLINLLIPLIAGAFLVLRLLQMDYIFLISSACLLFYGLALLNASKYTLGEIRYLGYCELILGIVSLWMPGHGLIFWALGFGVLHIIYGVIMWRKYERE